MRTAGAVVACLLILLLGLAVGRSCPVKPTKAERQADTVLADTTAFRLQREAQDSVIAQHSRETQALRRERKFWRDSTEKLLQAVDHEAELAAAIPEHIPPTASASDTIVVLQSALQAQQKVAARLRLKVIPGLQKVIALDTVAILKADETIAEQLRWRANDQRKIDQLTKALSDLRNERRGGGKFLGFMPTWTGKAVLAGASLYVGYQIGKRS